MSVIESTLLNFFLKYPEKSILIAYSGGVDSQVLLHAVSNLLQQNKLKNSISVCHVNHGLSSNAIEWENFAIQACKTRNVPLTIERVNVKEKPQHSLEALARDARYNAIKRLATTDTMVVTGHHNDDQAETFLLALKRGSGLKGLSAMKQSMPLADALLVRPLLNITRAQIEGYAQENKLEWIEDESNQDTRFDRNFIRHQVMPAITKRWPSFLSTLNRSAEHCQESVSLLAELAEQDLALCSESCNSGDKDKKLSVIELNKLSKARFNNLIRYFLEKCNALMPSKSQLSQLYHQLLANEDKTPEVKVGDSWIRRYKGYLYFTPELVDVTLFEHSFYVGDSTLYKEQVMLPDNLGTLVLAIHSDELGQATQVVNLLAPKVGQQVTIRFKHNNPTCLPDYRQKSRPLKKVLQELDIPTWQRKRIPFVYYDEDLVAAVGHFVCKPFIPEESDNTLKISW